MSPSSGSWPSCRLFWALAVLVGPHLPASEIQEPPLDSLPDYAGICQDAYRDTPMAGLGTGASPLDGWRRVELPPYGTGNGLNASLYERRLDDGRLEVALAFAGTEFEDRQTGLPDWRDAWTDIDQAVTIGERDLRAVPPQYRDALNLAKDVAARYSGRKDATLTLLGHSLGGGLAQYVSLHTGHKAVVFNSAPLGLETRRTVSFAQREASIDTIVNIHMRGEPIYGTPGVQFGRQYVVDPAPDLRVSTSQKHFMEPVIATFDYFKTRGAPIRLESVGSRPTGGGASAEGPLEGYIRVSRSAAESLASATQTLAGALDVLAEMPDQQLEILGRNLNLTRQLDRLAYRGGLNPTESGLLKNLSLLQKAYSVTTAIEQDIALARRGDFVLLRSHTLEEAAKIGFDAAWSQLFKQLAQRGAVAGKYPTFGLVDATIGAAKHVGAGRADIDVITHYLDAANAAAWGALGLVASNGNPRVAAVSQNIGQALAQGGRAATFGVTNWAFVRFRGQSKQLEVMWRTLQERRVHSDLPVQSFSQVFGDDVLAKNGLSRRQVAALDSEVASYEARRAAMHASGGKVDPGALPQSSPAVRNYWTSAEGGKTDARLQVEADMMMGLTRDARRVLVVGQGAAAQRMHSELQSKLGPGNVLWERSDVEGDRLQRMARSFGADAILGQRSLRTESRPGPQMREPLAPRPRRVDTPPPDRRDPFLWGGGGPPPPPPGGPANGIRATDVAYRDRALRRSQTSDIGGVMLAGSASVEDGAFSPSDGDFSLVFSQSTAGIDLTSIRRFLTALWAVYFSEDGPGISIDPIAPGVDKHIVRYIGFVINSDLGRVMREADYLMKKWAVGTERPDIPGFESPDDIAFRIGLTPQASHSRFWFVPAHMTFKKAGDMLLFVSGNMTLKTEYLSGHRRGGSDPANEEWARQFTRSYDAVADRYPVLSELHEYAKCVALARHLKEQGVPLLAFLLANKDMILTEDSPGTVDALVKKSDHFEACRIEGGVDLARSATPASFVIDEETARALQKALRTSPSQSVSPGPAQPTHITSFAAGEDSYSVADAQQLSIRGAAVAGDVFQCDFAARKDGQPALEIARCYDPESQGVATFGGGWHLMLPYAISTSGDLTVSFAGATLPKDMTLRNLLSGTEELLSFSTDRFPVAGYVPASLEESHVLGLFLLSDLSFRLADKLGNEFHFDPQGHITEMALGKSYVFKVQYGSETRECAGPAESYVRLVPVEGDSVQISSVSLPRRLRLAGDASDEGQEFTFDDGDQLPFIGYVPVGSVSSLYRGLALMTDGSFVLEDRAGGRKEFGPDGRLIRVTTKVVRSCHLADLEVAFDYELGPETVRICGAKVRRKGEALPDHVIAYEYDDRGRLAGVDGPGGRQRRVTYGCFGVASSL